jgi:hypothetical protein
MDMGRGVGTLQQLSVGRARFAQVDLGLLAPPPDSLDKLLG